MHAFIRHAASTICYPKGWAAPGNVPCQCNSWRALSKLKGTLPQRKIDVTSKSPVGDISVVTLIRTDTTLDHSQKAEKVWCLKAGNLMRHFKKCNHIISRLPNSLSSRFCFNLSSGLPSHLSCSFCCFAKSFCFHLFTYLTIYIYIYLLYIAIKLYS